MLGKPLNDFDLYTFAFKCPIVLVYVLPPQLAVLSKKLNGRQCWIPQWKETFPRLLRIAI